ncbi:PucR family transcriptional regulator [Treponema primitia]|uniref:PucR family transcriptional regulator n=1 Tax=Treponema primitia TaxID=88058 RepID=UPI0002554D35|nr:helix-turn-helix domain-containing protein [Treponema primitia]
MKISADILSRELKKLFNFAVFGVLDSELSLERPLFLRDGAGVKDNQIYITDAAMTSELPEKKTRSLLLYIQTDTGIGAVDRYIDFFDAILAFRAISLFDVYDAVQNIYSRFDKWDAELQDILIGNGGVQAMLDCSDPVFNNPLILHDNYFKVISFSKQYAEAFPSMSFAPEEGKTGHIGLSEYDVYSMQRAVLFPTSRNGVRSLYVNLFQQNRLQYRLLVLEHSRKFFPTDSALLEHLADRVQAVLSGLQDNAAERVRLPGIIRNILVEEFSNPVSVREQLDKFNWLHNHQYICMKVSLDDGSVKKVSLPAICEGIKKIVPGSCVFEYDSAVAVFINLNEPGENNPGASVDSFDGFSGEKTDRFSILMGTFLIENNLKAGVSAQFSGSGFENIKPYYTQAGIALNLGSRDKPMAHLYYFNSFAKLQILESCTRDLPASLICAPELIALKEYDRKHKTELYLTLSKYLQNHLSHTQTAIELAIHRSTLIYRLERIRSISSLNIEDSNNQWYLLLSFKLLDQGDSYKM